METRRIVLKGGIATTFCFGVATPRQLRAQTPSSLQILVPAAADSGLDKVARTVERALKGDGIVRDFKFEHVPGNGGTAGLAKFIETKKGQSNALMIGAASMIPALLTRKSPLSMTTLTPIARLAGEFEAIVTAANSSYKSMSDVVAALKADAGKVTWAAGSAGGTGHILAGMVAKATGVNPKAVKLMSYASDEAAEAALVANQVTVGISGWDDFADQIKAGKLRALAISADKRQDGVDAPSLREQGVAVDLFSWRGVFGAPDLSADQQKSLIGLIDRMAKGQTWVGALKKNGWTNLYLPGSDFRAALDSDVTRIRDILRDLGLVT